jgi:hypothetical protein
VIAMPIYAATTTLEKIRAMPDAPTASDPNPSREAAGLIATALLDGKPAPWTSWVAPEAIHGIDPVTRRIFKHPRYGRINASCAVIRVDGHEFVLRSETSEVGTVEDNNRLVELRREAILDLWAAARLKAKERMP